MPCLVETGPVFCSNCGQPSPDEALFCMRCGTEMAHRSPSRQSEVPLPSEPSAVAQSTSSVRSGAVSSSPNGSSHPEVSTQVAADASGRGAGGMEAEHDVWRGTVSWKALISFGWVLAFLLPVPLIIGCYSYRAAFSVHGTPSRWWLLSLVSLVGPLVFMTRLLLRRTTSYRITDERISVVYGVLSRASDDLLLIRVEDVQFRQGLLQRLLHVGDIRIVSTDRELPLLIIPGVEAPADFKEMLWRLVRQRRRNILPMEQLNNLSGVPGQ